MSEPKRTDMGKVMTMIEGMASTKTRKAAQGEAPYWLMRLAIRYSVPVPIKTAVKAQTPNRKRADKFF